jgi:transketolase
MGGLAWFETVTTGPAVLIAKTVKGKGISYMENNPSFHGAAPNDEQLSLGLKELGFTD